MQTVVVQTKRCVAEVIVVIVALCAAGCGGSLQVRATVETPPELPVRVFPEVVVVHGTSPDDYDLAEALAAHLASTRGGGLRVERTDERGVQRRRGAGALGPASAIVRVQTHMREHARPGFLARPESSCSSWGCGSARRTVMDELPFVVARVVLRVSEARNDRLLQELVLEEREEGSDPIGMRLRAVERLRARVIDAVDPGERQLEVELVDVDDPEVRWALEALRAGRSTDARAALERIVARPSFGARPPEQRARVLFDLGQARRLDARASTEAEMEQRLERAQRTISDAILVHPDATYARALAQISEERATRERMRAHRAAASHNFALDRAPLVPPAPPTYASEAPPRPR